MYWKIVFSVPLMSKNHLKPENPILFLVIYEPYALSLIFALINCYCKGLLAQAHRGILLVDDINLIDVDLVIMMLQAITDGFVIVEREGIAVKYPCRPILIATINPEETELKDTFLGNHSYVYS
jgi:hypothetical protein